MVDRIRDRLIKKLRYRYQTLEIGEFDIHIRTLKNLNQFNDPGDVAEKLGISSAQWPLFGVVWNSGYILAQYMYNFDIENKKILEIGCGIGVSSLMLNQRDAQITSSDCHPEVEGFLEFNTGLNPGPIIPYFRSDWGIVDDHVEKFDLIIGSDLLYEKEHHNMLSEFIERHAKQSCEVIIVDPGRGRGHLNNFTRIMQTNGYEYTREKQGDLLSMDDNQNLKLSINCYMRK